MTTYDKVQAALSLMRLVNTLIKEAWFESHHEEFWKVEDEELAEIDALFEIIQDANGCLEKFVIID